MSIENKVLERVKKMIALGNDAAATEAERETALRMAYNLLAKYNLSMSDLPEDESHEARERQDVVISADRLGPQPCPVCRQAVLLQILLQRHRYVREGQTLFRRASK